jgi:hypothetical protein
VTNLEALYHWVREREATRLRKAAGGTPPWTDDPIIGTYRFCNVRREDDRVTVWVRERVREPFADHPYLWLMLCAARVLNWPATLADLIGDPTARLYPGAWYDDPAFSPQAMADALNDRASTGQKVFTGAYIVTAPSKKGARKTDHVALRTLGALWRDRDQPRWRSALDGTRHLWEVHAELSRYDGWGPFMAYQVVVDLRFTRYLRDAPDRETWTAHGPGTLRGLNRVYGRRLDATVPASQARRECLELYRSIPAETGVALDLSDVPNVLCETDKYLRVRNGEGKPRALYVPGRGS